MFRNVSPQDSMQKGDAEVQVSLLGDAAGISVKLWFYLKPGEVGTCEKRSLTNPYARWLFVFFFQRADISSSSTCKEKLWLR